MTMKNKFFIIALCCTFFLTGCNDDDPVTITPELDVEFASEPIPAEGGQLELNVFSNSEWTVTYKHTDDRITSINPTSGTGDKEVTVTVAPNEGDARDIELTVALKDGSISVDIRVVQTAAPEEPEEPAITMTYYEAYYYGYPYPEVLQGNYSFFFYDIDPSKFYDPSVTEDAIQIYIDLNAEVIDEILLLPAEGVYVGELTGNMQTFNLGYERSDGYWASSAYAIKGHYDFYPLVDGTVKISREGNVFTFDMNVTANMLNGETQVIKAQYKGEIEVQDRRQKEPEPPFSTLNNNVLMNFFDTDYSGLAYFGQDSENTDYWEIMLVGSDVVVDEEGYIVSGEYILMELYSNLIAGDKILPHGRYNVNKTHEPYTIEQGWMGMFWEEHSWYYKYEDGSMVAFAPLTTGYLDASHEGDEYTFSFRFKDDLDYKIEGDFQGSLYFYDDTDYISPAKSIRINKNKKVGERISHTAHKHNNRFLKR